MVNEHTYMREGATLLTMRSSNLESIWSKKKTTKKVENIAFLCVSWEHSHNCSLRPLTFLQLQLLFLQLEFQPPPYLMGKWLLNLEFLDCLELCRPTVLRQLKNFFKESWVSWESDFFIFLLILLLLLWVQEITLYVYFTRNH